VVLRPLFFELLVDPTPTPEVGFRPSAKSLSQREKLVVDPARKAWARVSKRELWWLVPSLDAPHFSVHFQLPQRRKCFH
jgi:hypothetical protein